MAGYIIDYYGLLDIEMSATDSEIQSAFREKAFYYHPDKNISPYNGNAIALFYILIEGVKVLTDPLARKMYDKKLQLQRDELDEPFGEHEYNWPKQLFQKQIRQEEENRKLQELIEMDKRERYILDALGKRINWRKLKPELLPERFQKVLIREKQERLRRAFKYTCICGIVIIAIYKIKNFVYGPVPLPNSKVPFPKFSTASFLE